MSIADRSPERLERVALLAERHRTGRDLWTGERFPLGWQGRRDAKSAGGIRASRNKYFAAQDAMFFRAFRMFYDVVFAEEADLLLRLAETIEASSRPQNPALAEKWMAEWERQGAA